MKPISQMILYTGTNGLWNSRTIITLIKEFLIFFLPGNSIFWILMLPQSLQLFQTTWLHSIQKRIKDIPLIFCQRMKEWIQAKNPSRIRFCPRSIRCWILCTMHVVEYCFFLNLLLTKGFAIKIFCSTGLIYLSKIILLQID